MKVDGVEISSSDKIYFPESKITKGQVVKYYEKIADKMLPFLKDRPLTLQRFPEGINEDGFYQKNAADYFPDFIKTVKIPTKDGENTQVYCNSTKALIYLANQGTISFHTWLSKRDILNKPDKVVFDLDPPEGKFEDVKKAAKIVRSYLKEKGENPKLMTTGKSGLHLYYYKDRYHSFDDVKEKVRHYAEEMANRHPDLLTTKTKIDQREGKIFLDYLRNAYAQTSICPYSLRPNQSAGIATPINWNQLDELKTADQYNLKKQLPGNA